jgi:hypothetical protein
MSQQLANHLKSYGRGGDTELVHMTKGEVKGLQDLAMAAGGSLTINPDTGLVEAGFLKQLLPAIAGAGLMMIPGMQGIGAGWIGAGIGALEAARTGDIGKGLMAGLGAYGGAGLAGGLMGTAAGAAAPTGTGLSTAGGAGAGTSVTPTATGGLNAASSNFGITGAPPAGGITFPSTSSVGALNPSAVSSNIGITAPSTALSYTPSAPSMAGSQIAKYGFAAATPAIADASTPKPIGGLDTEKSSGEYISKDFRAYTPNQPDPYYRPRGLGYTGYAAQGGMMPDNLSYAIGGQVDPMQRMPNGGLAALQGMRDGYGAAQTMDGNIPQFNEGGKLRMKQMKIGDGIFKDTNPNTANLGADEAAEYYVKTAAKKSKVPYTKMPKTSVERLGEINVGIAKAAGGSIGGYSDGGRMLKGPGDGMSDSIPGVIGNKQPARLADGEFVVPADVVSHLGNGSTDAGAKRLYAMMDKVRKARTGTKKQGKQIKPEKYMPA